MHISKLLCIDEFFCCRELACFIIFSMVSIWKEFDHNRWETLLDFLLFFNIETVKVETLLIADDVLVVKNEVDFLNETKRKRATYL